jgi:hypothetical protein
MNGASWPRDIHGYALEITLCATWEHSAAAHAMPGDPGHYKTKGRPNCTHGDAMGICRCTAFVAGCCIWVSTDKRRAIRLPAGEVPKAAVA